MKHIVKVALALLMAGSTTAYADCNSLISVGESKGARGNGFTQMSSDSLAKMKELILENASNAQICDAAREARMGAYLAAVNFKASRAAYLMAINECSPPNDTVVAKNADITTASYNGHAKTVADLDNIMGSQCGAPPLTSILNSK